MYSSLSTDTIMLLPDGILTLNIIPSAYFLNFDNLSALPFFTFYSERAGTGSGLISGFTSGLIYCF